MSVERFAKLMLDFSLFEGYTAWGTQTLIERGRIRECPAGEVLFTQGQPAKEVVLVLTGEVEQFVQSHGREVRLAVVGPSHVLSDVQVLADMAHPLSGRTVGDTAILVWDGPTFQRLVAGDSVFAHRVFHQTAMELAAQAETLTASLVAIKEEA